MRWRHRPPEANGPALAITTPDPNGGHQTSLVLDAGGNAVDSYRRDVIQGGLAVFHCGNPACDTGNAVTPVDTPPDVGYFSSIALDAAGHPVVSYFDQTNDDLKVLHCGNPACNAGNAIASLDTANSGGWFSSLAVDAGGSPLVSYSDPLVGLKLLHCGDANCGATPAPTPSPAPSQYVLWGAVHCDGEVDSVDALADLVHGALLPPLSHALGCPDIDQSVEVAGFSLHPWGDVDCEGAANSLDALRILRFVAHLSLTPIAACPDVGAEVQITP
jgi:hypothetical protein